MTTVRIALIEPWPGRRMGGRGFRISSFLVVLADDSAGRALPVWLNGPEGHGLFRGDGDHPHPHPEPAEAITAGLLSAAGVTVTGVDIDELDPALTTGRGTARPRAGRRADRVHRAGTAEPGQIRPASGTRWPWPRRRRSDPVADQLMDRLAVPARYLAGQFTGTCRCPSIAAAGRGCSGGPGPSGSARRRRAEAGDARGRHETPRDGEGVLCEGERASTSV